MKDKKELIRIVRNDEGEFSLDRTGKTPGRGAYICPNGECLAKAQKSKGLERSFKAPVPKEVYEQLLNELEEEGNELVSFSSGTLQACRQTSRRRSGS